MLVMDDYQRGWALRYLREAKAEFAAAKKNPSLASGLILEASRKAQAAIYYVLGTPTFITPIIRENAYKRRVIDDPILKCLVEVELTMQQISHTANLDYDGVFKQVDGLIRTASDIVALFIDERA
ncbi:MAG: hypothetical protein U9O89_03505 [Thermoproteota archaeon]|nr:hypothetical protein [Thermoproteota archaeon]